MNDNSISKKRKLLLIVPSMHQGGQERVVVRTAGLLKESFDVTVCIFDGSDMGYDVSELDLVNLDVPTRPGRAAKLINILKRTHRLKELKKKLRPDISYSYGPSANIINCLSRIDAYPGEKSGKASETWVGLRNFTDAVQTKRMELCVSRADLIVCCARDIEAEVCRRYGVSPVAAKFLSGNKGAGGTQMENARTEAVPQTKKAVHTAVLYNLYDIDGIIADSEKEEPDEGFIYPAAGAASDDGAATEGDTLNGDGGNLRYIMSMGRDDDQKMFWHMLRTFSAVVAKVPEARLVILGAGSWEDYCSMAAQLGIEQYVLFPGMQTNPYRYLKYGEINWMTTRNEGFPNALVEGMALGMAAVCTNCLTGPAEILTEGGNTPDCEKIFETDVNEAGQDTASEQNGSLSRLTRTDADGLPLRAIYGEYGILTPALDREKTMFTDHITPEEYSLAEVLTDLLKDRELLDGYRKAAAGRAKDFTYGRYLEEFMKLADR